MINLSIVIYFLIFAFVLAWMFFKVNGHLKQKIGMIAAMFYISSAIIFSFNTYLGWPTRDSDAPDTMILTGILIFEEVGNKDGSIYVTGIPCTGKKSMDECMLAGQNDTTLAAISPYRIFGYEPPVINTPRIYQFPWTDENRKMFAEARENMKKGGRSVFRRGKKNGEEGEGGAQAEGDGKPGSRKGQPGEGTINSETKGAKDIWIDNRRLSDFLQKDQTE